MCNSLQVPFPAPTTSVAVTNVVCSNTSITSSHFSPGKIFPRESNQVKQNTATSIPNFSIGKKAPRCISEDDSHNFKTTEDVSNQQEITTLESLRQGQNLAASKLPFLWKLHILLDDVEATGNDHIVSWLEHGRSFKVYRPKSFIAMIAPHYFKQSKYKSFQRQLHLYEFTRVQYGPEAGSYSHPLFIRGEPHMCLSLSPIKIKGKAGRQQRKELSAAAAVPIPPVVVPTPGKRARPSSEAPVATAVLSKREQEEWVAKIQSMLVKGSVLAAELEQKKQHQEQQAEAKSSNFLPLAATSFDIMGQDGDSNNIQNQDDTCSLFGGNFHLLPHQEEVSACEHCCESDTEDEIEWDLSLLQSE